MERRLAAVLIADVVGYVRLSQADEEGTRAQFRTDLQDVFEPAIAAHRGRLVKTMGDALLVEFHSVVDALRCAVEAQRHKAQRNLTVQEAKRLQYRIGINLGDVIIEGDDIHGDGVSIADRLQTLAEAGGICVSGSVFDQVEGKLEFAFRDAGRQMVKNISNPVRTYLVAVDENALPKLKKRRGIGNRTIWLVLPAGLAIGAAATTAFIWHAFVLQPVETGIDYHLAGQHEVAVSMFRAVDRLDLESRLFLVVSLVRSSRDKDAQAEASTIMQEFPQFSISEYLEKPGSLEVLNKKAKADFARDLRAAGLPEYPSFDCLARGDCK